MNFEITEDVQDLLKILRETGFDWIASEIQNLIKEGKAIDKLISEPTSRSLRKPQIETATVPFPADEQLAIALSSIHEYTITTASILRVVQKEIGGPLDRPDMTIQIVSDEDVELATIDPDSVGHILPPSVDEWLALLGKTLEESWPQSQGSFGSRVRDSGRRVEW